MLPKAWRLKLVRSYLFLRDRGWALRRHVRHWRYAGSNVECPFCEGTFSQFRPTGALKRPFWQSAEGQNLLQLSTINVANAMCPRCGSGERHRLLYFYLRDRLSILGMRDTKLLDVAPDGFLWDKVFAHAEVEYFSIDVTPARKPTIIMSVTDLACPDSTFDAVVCYHVLEHTPDDVRALQELYRVLRPGGWAILQVPIWAEATVEDPTVPKEEYAGVYGHRDHVRRYGLDYKDRLASAGFRVTLDEFARHLPKDLIRRYGLFETEDIYFCEKA